MSGPLEPPPGERPAPTRRDAPAHRDAAPTRRDEPAGDLPRQTRRDDPARPAGYHRVNLPPPLQERYRTVRDLAQGGEGNAVLAEDTGSGAEVVVKVYAAGIRLDAATTQRLRRASDRHVVRAERGEWTAPDGTVVPWEVLEYLPLGSLADMMARQPGPLPAERVRAVLTELAAALRHIHEDLGIVHRDLKPDNVLVRRLDPLELVLGDLGLATELRLTRRFSRVVGTLAYQAPETLHSNDARAPRDWWSLGVMLVELLTGQHPYRDPAGRDLSTGAVRDALTIEAPDLSGVDGRWLNLCRGLLTRAPQERWSHSEVRSWLAGADPALGASAPSPDRPAAPAVRPFEFAGQAFTTPVELAEAMGEHWSAARDLVGGPHFRTLDRWLAEEIGDRSLAINLLSRRAVTFPLADLTILRLRAHFAPDAPPVFQGYPADAHSLAHAAAGRVAGADPSTAFVDDVSGAALVLLARHPCENDHPECRSGHGCAVLREAGRQFDAAWESFCAAAADIGRYAGARPEFGAAAGPGELPSTADGPLPRSIRRRARAALLRSVLDPDYARTPTDTLARVPPAARPDWWYDLRREADEADGARRTALALLALELAVPAQAIVAADAAAEAARRAEHDAWLAEQDRLRRMEAAAAAWGTIPNRLTLSIVAILVCFPLGIPAVVYAAQVDSRLRDGDVAGARHSSRLALAFSIASILVTVLVCCGSCINLVLDDLNPPGP